MATKKGRREKTKFVGVYAETSSVKRHLGKPDKVFIINYTKDGKLIWEKIGWMSEGYTAQMASNIRAERITQIRHGQEIPQEKKARLAASITLDEFFFGQYLPAIKRDQKGAGVLESGYRTNISPIVGKLKLAEISAAHFADLKKRLQTTPNKRGTAFAPATIRWTLATFKMILSKAAEWNVIPTNPLSEVQAKVKVQNSRTEFFRPEQIDALLAELAKNNDPLLREAVLLALKTGLRAGEIAALRWADIDFNNMTIRVLGKNGEIENVYPPASIFEMLNARKGAPGELVFPGPKGGKERFGFRAVREAIDRLGFNDFASDGRQKLCFHSLRHTYASWLAMAGIPIYDIAKLMRHKSISMTERYAKLAPNFRTAALEVMEKYQPVKVVNNDCATKLIE